MRIPLLMTSLHRGIAERQLNIQAEIDAVDSIPRTGAARAMGGHHADLGVQGAALAEGVVMSEVSEVPGMQLNRLLVLATASSRARARRFRRCRS